MAATLNALLQDKNFIRQVKYSQKNYSSNDIILATGTKRSHIYFIKSGLVKVALTETEGIIEGNTIIKNLHPGIHELGPNEIFGELGFFDNAPACADVIAVVDTEIVEIEYSSLQKYFNSNPETGYKVLTEILTDVAVRIRHANKTIMKMYSWALKSHELDKYL